MSTLRHIPKPETGEYPPYASMYIDLLPDDGRVLHHLREAPAELEARIQAVATDRLLVRYAPGKWRVKEVLVHIIDDERIYAYRALRLARGDQTPLPGFDQDTYALSSAADARSLESILSEYRAVRSATLELFANLDEAALLRGGIADGKYVTVRALAYHIAGHERHHLNLLRDCYNIA